MNHVPKPTVVVDRVSQSFDSGPSSAEHHVLKHINLTVQQGEFVCLVGTSGCGKSTLLNLIGGFLEPTHGGVWVGDRRVRGPSRDCIFIFQEGAVFPWLTVQQNIGFGLMDRSQAEQQSTTDRYLQMVGLEKFRHTYPKTLSGGMKQRVELARALAANPSVLLMDEPLGALDFLTRLQMRSDLLRICKAEQKTVLFVTHDIDEALQLGDRTIVLGGKPCTVIDEVVFLGLRPRDTASAEYQSRRTRILETMLVHRSQNT